MKGRSLMNQKLQSPLLWTAILGALKLLLDVAGIQIPDARVNEIANGIAAVLAVVGMWMDHSKVVVEPVSVVVVPAPIVIPPGDPIVQ